VCVYVCVNQSPPKGPVLKKLTVAQVVQQLSAFDQRVDKNLSLSPDLSTMNQVHNLTPHFVRSILIVFHLHALNFANGLFSSRLPKIPHPFITFHICATDPLNLPILIWSAKSCLEISTNYECSHNLISTLKRLLIE